MSMDYSVKNPQQLGQVLQGLRRDRGLSQTELGARIGLLQSEVSKFEADPSTSSLRRLFRYLSALGLDIAIRDRSASPARARKARGKRDGDSW